MAYWWADYGAGMMEDEEVLRRLLALNLDRSRESLKNSDMA